MSALPFRALADDSAAVDAEATACPAVDPDDGVFVEALDAADAAAFAAPWHDLATRSLEPNVYFEPAFALASAARAGKRLRFVFVWERERRRLLALCPIVLPRLPLPFALAGAFTHNNMTCAMPLVDAAQAQRAWTQILRWCRRQGLCGLMVPDARLDAAAIDGRGTAVHGRFERAVLDCRTALPASGGLRTLRKNRRRLERFGAVQFEIVRDSGAVAEALESFLELEAAGWKAGRGALASRPELAAFGRAAVNGLAMHGGCRIASLALDGVPIAMGIVLVSGHRAFFWKIAYDEAFAAYSPGVLLAQSLTDRLLADPDVDVADSCADAGHPMIEKLWPERQPVGTLFVRAAPGPAFSIAVALTRLKLDARLQAKRVFHRLRDSRRAASPHSVSSP